MNLHIKVWSKFWYMHTHETIITIEIMKYPSSSFHPFSSLSPPSNPGNHDLLSITIGSIFLGSYKNGILLYILLVFNFVWFLPLNVSVFISIMHVLVAQSFFITDFCVITMYGYTTICVSSHLLMNIWPMNSFWLLQTKPFWTFVYILCFFPLLGRCCETPKYSTSEVYFFVIYQNDHSEKLQTALNRKRCLLIEKCISKKKIHAYKQPENMYTTFPIWWTPFCRAAISLQGKDTTSFVLLRCELLYPALLWVSCFTSGPCVQVNICCFSPANLSVGNLISSYTKLLKLQSEGNQFKPSP